MNRILWIMPVSMTALNACSLLVGVVCEGRIKLGALKFFILYGSSILPAMRGDLSPFIQAISTNE